MDKHSAGQRVGLVHPRRMCRVAELDQQSAGQGRAGSPQAHAQSGQAGAEKKVLIFAFPFLAVQHLL